MREQRDAVGEPVHHEVQRQADRAERQHALKAADGSATAHRKRTRMFLGLLSL